MKCAIYLLPLGLLLVPAAAAQGEFVTWGSLGTYAGAVMMTTVAGRFFSRVPALRQVDALLLGYGTALVLLLGAAAFGGEGLTLQSGLLCAFNAVIVALAAEGMSSRLRAGDTGSTGDTGDAGDPAEPDDPDEGAPKGGA